ERVAAAGARARRVRRLAPPGAAARRNPPVQSRRGRRALDRARGVPHGGGRVRRSGGPAHRVRRGGPTVTAPALAECSARTDPARREGAPARAPGGGVRDLEAMLEKVMRTADRRFWMMLVALGAVLAPGAPVAAQDTPRGIDPLERLAEVLPPEAAGDALARSEAARARGLPERRLAHPALAAAAQGRHRA